MDAAICVRVTHDCVDESPASLVQVPSVEDELREWCLMLLKKEFRERRTAIFGLWECDIALVKSFRDRLRCPNLYIHPGHFLDFFQDSTFPFEDFISRSLNAVSVHSDTLHRHFDQDWEEVKFEINNVPKVFLSKLNSEVVPEFKRENRISFSVGSDIHTRHLPHLALRIDTKFLRGSD